MISKYKITKNNNTIKEFASEFDAYVFLRDELHDAKNYYVKKIIAKKQKQTISAHSSMMNSLRSKSNLNDFRR